MELKKNRWLLGIGDWGLGIGNWLSVIQHPERDAVQSRIFQPTSGIRYQSASNRHPASGISYLITVICYLLLASLCTSCYTFRGSSISPDLKNIQIANFAMNTSGGPANMALSMSEKTKEYFQRNSGLKLVSINPDMQLEGSITGFEVSPVAPTVSSGSSSFGNSQQSTDRGGLNRLTITVQVRFSNNKDETKNFDQSFSFYADFPQNQTITQVESSLVPKILDQLVLDIFNKAAGDW